MRTGYIRASLNNKMVLVHRLALSVHLGRELSADETVDHECHNRSDCMLGNDCPHRRCIEPTHLAAVPALENQRNRHFNYKTHCPNGHRYCIENARPPRDGSWWDCRACRRARRAGRDPKLEPAAVL